MKVENGKITERFSTFVNPKIPIPFRITQLTSITDQMVMDAPDIETVLSGVTMPYTEANYAIAQAEAYQGQITAEDDGAPAPPPTAQEQLRADVDFLAAMQGVAL